MTEPDSLMPPQLPQHGGGGVGGCGGAGGTTILKLRGLPFHAKVWDIIHWFQDPAIAITPLTPDRCVCVCVCASLAGFV